MQTMYYKGFNARIMRAQRLVGSGIHGLPPGTPIDVYPVDAFEVPLENWITGPGNYVVPVSPDWGLWFDWTDNDKLNTAVLLSIKGMNPITGQRTNGFGLERYEEKCPVHETPFKDGLFCEQCNYKWPNQNYVAFPNTLWWDGFRSTDGKVRQFFFTEELAKSIPELVIGKEDTVPAFGFAFFRAKKRREFEKSVMRGSPSLIGLGSPNPTKTLSIYNSGSGLKGLTDVKYKSSFSSGSRSMFLSSNSFKGANSAGPEVNDSHSINYCSTDSVDLENLQPQDDTWTFDESAERRKTAEVGVGAGAIINQSLTVDPLKVSDWEDKPDSVMRLFFVFVEQFKEIEAKGMKNLAGHPEGYLSDLPVG